MIKCKIVTPLGVYKEMETTILNIKNQNGQLGILTNHVPVVTMLSISKMSTIEDGKRQEYAIGGGLLYFENNRAKILVDSIEHKSEINEERAMAAKLRAEATLGNEMAESQDLQKAELSLKRAVNRLSVSGNG